MSSTLSPPDGGLGALLSQQALQISGSMDIGASLTGQLDNPEERLVASAATAATVILRRSLSHAGTRIGSRQAV